MCGKCESCMGKAGMGLGLLSMVLAAASKLAHFTVMGVGPRSFAAAASLFFLLSISANTAGGGACSCCHEEEEAHDK